MSDHHIFSSQFWGLSVYIKFNLSHLLYIIDGNVGVCIIGKEMSDKSQPALISIDTHTHTQSIQVVLLISVHC